MTADIKAQLYDIKTLMVLKTYPTETPLNSAAIAAVKPYVRPLAFSLIPFRHNISFPHARCFWAVARTR